MKVILVHRDMEAIILHKETEAERAARMAPQGKHLLHKPGTPSSSPRTRWGEERTHSTKGFPGFYMLTVANTCTHMQ